MKMQSKRHGFYKEVMLRRDRQISTQSEQTEMQADCRREVAGKVKYMEEAKTAAGKLKCAPKSVELVPPPK